MSFLMAGRVRYTKELLETVIQESKSWAEVCRRLGVKPMTGAQSHIKNRAVHFGIDHSHFTGQGWAKGKTFCKRPLSAYLNNEAAIHSDKLRRRLIEEGYKEARCEICRLTKWEGKPIPLELDHINSDHYDNRLENLQVVCPNCHALETGRRRQAPVAQRQEASVLGTE